MKNSDMDAGRLAAMPLNELEKLAAPVLAALKAKKDQAAKEERARRRKEYDKARRKATVAVSFRFDDKASADAVRTLINNMKAAAKKNGRTVAKEVDAAKDRLPTGRRKSRSQSIGETKPVATNATPAKGKPSAPRELD
jgi:hypothetical protein